MSTSTGGSSNNTKAKAKRAPSKYTIFVLENMPKIKADNPGISPQEALKKVGAMWREMRGTVNPSVPPTKSVQQASKKLVKTSTYYTVPTSAKSPSAKSSSSKSPSTKSSSSKSPSAKSPSTKSSPSKNNTKSQQV